MFEKMKERRRQRQEEEERRRREERARLLAMSEKELMVEILMELRYLEDQIEDVETSIALHCGE